MDKVNLILLLRGCRATQPASRFSVQREKVGGRFNVRGKMGRAKECLLGNNQELNILTTTK